MIETAVDEWIITMPTPSPASFISDPDTLGEVSPNYDTVECSTPTNEPNRYTVHVPFDLTTLSLGKESSRWIRDPGITGRTKNHVHFHATEDPKTMVSLGGPAANEGFDGFDGDVIKRNRGFSMVTDGNAWMDANKQFYVVSRTEDVIIRAHAAEKTAALHSDMGSVSIAAKKKVSVGSAGDIWIGADLEGHVEDKKFEKVIDSEVGKWIANKTVKTLMTSVDTYFSAAAVFAKAADVEKKSKDGVSGWDLEDNWSKAKFLVDVFKVASTIGRYATEFTSEGKVSIMATTFAGMTGNIAASVFGNLSASLSSAVSASVLGGTASLKGILWTSVWSGVQTSIKSIKDVEMKAEKGKAKVTGKKETEIVAQDGPLKLTGEKEVQVSSATKSVVVHAPKVVAIAAGDSNGFGLRAEGDWVFVGKVSTPKNFVGMGKEPQLGLEITNDKVEMRKEQSGLTLDGSLALLESPEIKLHAKNSNVTVNGAKILLG
ncbi:MAG: hypothetical protein R3B70_02370 [Polyangiaceae bacterium]